MAAASSLAGGLQLPAASAPEITWEENNSLRHRGKGRERVGGWRRGEGDWSTADGRGPGYADGSARLVGAGSRGRLIGREAGDPRGTAPPTNG
ncbi:hypothetical protein chiPu_0031788 [Chiloscyllium punctatum]|uniref:Uncharacterized protein n=1 Tax=Chiloscyllium punctatum TaxID=137246 RepID=A0A401TXF7_CHIPU|nr:hypothetical protein [Chiloscyllium punctatum]